MKFSIKHVAVLTSLSINALSAWYIKFSSPDNIFINRQEIIERVLSCASVTRYLDDKGALPVKSLI